MCDQTNNPINEIINKYFSDLENNIENFEKTKNNIKSKVGILGYTYYDICPINKNHSLNNYISKTIYGLNPNENKDNATYAEHAGIVFDDGTYNFHIFPNNNDTCNNLSNEYAKLRTKLLIAIYEKLISNDCDKKIKNGFEKNYKKCIDQYENEKKAQKEYSLWGGKGVGQSFKRYNHVIAASNQPTTLNCLIYKFIEIEIDKISYTINFMRYTCDENGVVGCTMRAIQFHKDDGCINKDSNQQLNICYPNTYKKRKKFSICYPKNADNGNIGTNSAGNICYNPPVKWPKKGEEWNNQINDIVESFLDFIINNEKYLQKAKIDSIADKLIDENK